MQYLDIYCCRTLILTIIDELVRIVQAKVLSKFWYAALFDIFKQKETSLLGNVLIHTVKDYKKSFQIKRTAQSPQNSYMAKQRHFDPFAHGKSKPDE